MTTTATTRTFRRVVAATEFLTPILGGGYAMVYSS